MSTNIYHPRPSTIGLNARSGDRGMDWAIYVNTNESLQVTITSSIGGNVPSGSGLTGVSVNIDVRMLTVNNGLQYLTFTFVPGNDYSTDTYDIKLPEGFLLNISAYTTGVVVFVANGLPVEPMLGQTWVNLSIVAPVNPNRTMATYLTQGYVTNEERIAYPPQQPISYYDGYPFFRFANVPPSGYQIPQNAINEITAVLFTLSTNVAATQRQVYLAFQSSAGIPATNRTVIIPFQAQQGPSITLNYHAWIGASNATYGPSEGSLGTFAPLPARLRLKAGELVAPGLSNADPGDVVSDLCIWGNEWLVP